MKRYWNKCTKSYFNKCICVLFMIRKFVFNLISINFLYYILKENIIINYILIYFKARSVKIVLGFYIFIEYYVKRKKNTRNCTWLYFKYSRDPRVRISPQMVLVFERSNYADIRKRPVSKEIEMLQKLLRYCHKKGYIFQ